MVRTAVNLLLPISLAVGVCLCRGQRSGPPISWGTEMSPVPHRPARRDLPAAVSAVDLSAPKPAVKAFEKVLKSWDKGKLREAELAFKNAILLYPSFASAYNNLGVVFLHEGRRDDANPTSTSGGMRCCIYNRLRFHSVTMERGRAKFSRVS